MDIINEYENINKIKDNKKPNLKFKKDNFIYLKNKAISSDDLLYIEKNLNNLIIEKNNDYILFKNKKNCIKHNIINPVNNIYDNINTDSDSDSDDTDDSKLNNNIDIEIDSLTGSDIDSIYNNEDNNINDDNNIFILNDYKKNNNISNQEYKKYKYIKYNNIHILFNLINNNEIDFLKKIIRKNNINIDVNNTILYETLLCNYIIGNNIYVKLCNLEDIFYKDEHNTKLIEIDSIIKYLIIEYRKINIGLNNNNNKKIYDENSFNFCKIYELYKNKIEDLKNKINEIYNEINPVEFIMINKKNGKEIVIYEKENEIDKNISELLLLIDSYLVSVQLVILLYNEHAHKYIKHIILHLYNKKNENEKIIIDKINKLFKKNKFLDINYINEYDNLNILTYIISNYELINLVKHIIELGGQINDEYNLLDITIKKKLFHMFTLLLEIVNIDILNREHDILNTGDEEITDNLHCFDKKNKKSEPLYFLILKNNEIKTNKKLEMLNILIKRNIDFSLFDSIIYIIHLENPYRFLDILLLNNKIIDNLDQNDINIAIEYRDNNILKLLLEKLNGELNNLQSIFLCLELLIKNENDVKLMEILLTILKFKPNLNILNEHNLTPLLYTIKKNENLSLLLLENGSDPFFEDNDGNNILIYSVKYNFVEIIKIILDSYKDNIYLINMKNKQGFTGLTAIILSHEPKNILMLLQKNKNIDYNTLDINGYNIIDNIIESTLSDKLKYELCEILINFVDVSNINEQNKIPTIIRAINNNLFDIVKIILYNLVNLKKITIKSGDLDKLFSGKNEDVIIDVKNKNQCNFYPLVINYLKNNFHNVKDKNIHKYNNKIDNNHFLRYKTYPNKQNCFNKFIDHTFIQSDSSSEKYKKSRINNFLNYNKFNSKQNNVYHLKSLKKNIDENSYNLIVLYFLIIIISIKKIKNLKKKYMNIKNFLI